MSLLEIVNAKHITDILLIDDNFNKEYKLLLTKIHPDKCKDPLATEASANLNKLKSEFENMYSLYDESGEYKTNEISIEFKNNPDKILNISFDNYKKLHSKADDHFKKYMPLSFGFNGSIIKIILRDRCIPLSKISKLEEVHGIWLLSRLLEYCIFIRSTGNVHLGFSFNSIFINPKNHGIQIVSFYHLTKIDDKINTINGQLANYYPDSLFKEKIALTEYDINLCKKIVISMLGDKTGLANSLRGKIKQPFLDFLKTKHKDIHLCYEEYRKMLKNNYESKFHILNI